jgi:heat shock protein HtpX
MNIFKTGILMIALTALFMLIGSFFGEGGLMIAFVLAVVMNFGSYWFSDKIVLSMYKAQEVSPQSELYRIVQEQAQRSGLPMPRVYTIPTDAPNAFATGRNPQNAAIAVTDGVVRLLSRDELAGVIGHEMAHVKHRDILISTIVATMAGAIMMIANMAQWAAIFGGFREDDDEDGGGGIIGMLFLIIVAPIAAMIIQFAISRSREYAADRGGAEICGNPLSLANALRKLERGVEARPMQVNAATSHLFIANPLRGGLAGLFSTHPPMDERIRLLEAQAGYRR